MPRSAPVLFCRSHWIVNTSLGGVGSAPCSSVHVYKKPKAEAASVPAALIGNLVESGNTSCAYGEATQNATTIYFQFGFGTSSGPMYRVAK